MAREDRRPGGLGRPLDAIIAGAPSRPLARAAARVPAPEIDAVVAAGLDAVSMAIDLDVVGYLHRANDRGPHLTARVAGSPPDPGDAFDLLRAATATVETPLAAPDSAGELAVLGMIVVTVVSAGPRSRGVHLLGRRHPRLDAAEIEVAGRLCRALAAACHTVEEAWAAASAWATAPQESAS